MLWSCNTFWKAQRNFGRPEIGFWFWLYCRSLFAIFSFLVFQIFFRIHTQTVSFPTNRDYSTSIFDEPFYFLLFRSFGAHNHKKAHVRIILTFPIRGPTYISTAQVEDLTSIFTLAKHAQESKSKYSCVQRNEKQNSKISASNTF